MQLSPLFSRELYQAVDSWAAGQLSSLQEVLRLKVTWESKKVFDIARDRKINAQWKRHKHECEHEILCIKHLASSLWPGKDPS